GDDRERQPRVAPAQKTEGDPEAVGGRSQRDNPRHRGRGLTRRGLLSRAGACVNAARTTLTSPVGGLPCTVTFSSASYPPHMLKHLAETGDSGHEQTGASGRGSPRERGGSPHTVGIGMAKVVALDGAPRRTRLGRPPGSTGSQTERNKHRL